MTFVATLEPTFLWSQFDRILTIPRGSKKEQKIRDYVIGEAERHGLAYQVDEVGNVVVRKPAAPGCEGAAVTILQSHLDMVNEKNSDVAHDFDTDPIRPERDGEYLTAAGTTLGSDNGMGVATMLALMGVQDVRHGPLELLFTVDEETGLTGAAGLDAGMLEGRRLINLDSEEEGIVYVGCAGGADSNLRLSTNHAPAPAGSTAIRIKLFGMKGGHSGVDIHLQRGNAVQLLARCLHAISLSRSFSLAGIEGGGVHNAIPREAFATVVVPVTERAAFLDRVNQETDAIKSEFQVAEPGMKLEVTDAQVADQVWDESTAATVLRLITGLPHGVLAMSHDIPDLVETSTNLATVKLDNGAVAIGLSSRSSVASALTALRQRIRAIGELAGASVEEGNGYPGWKPNLESPILAVVRRVHREVLHQEGEIKAIHAGLECGIIGEKVSGMDMVSIGPQIEYPHSPDERVRIDSVEKFYRLLTATLEELAKTQTS